VALPVATRRALVVLSADDGTTGFLAAALAAEGLTIADLEPAERAGVVGIGPTRAMFSHPLVRAAVYQAAEAPERRRAHRAHAASAAAIGESALDRRAWHLALAATGPDEAAAAELEAAGLRATARNGHAGACEALEAAARLSPEVRERGRRLLASGQGALAAGDFVRAGRLFDEVAALDADPAQALEALVGRGYVETFGGSARRAVDLLVAAAERLEASPRPARRRCSSRPAFPAPCSPTCAARPRSPSGRRRWRRRHRPRSQRWPTSPAPSSRRSAAARPRRPLSRWRSCRGASPPETPSASSGSRARSRPSC
jgi:hypothetical protein